MAIFCSLIFPTLKASVKASSSYKTGSFKQAFGTEGKRKMVSGDAYIGFVKFPKNGGLPLIETVNTFGASSIKGNKHFADQRPLYQAQQLKKMTLDKNEVLKNAESVYHPQ